MDIRPDWGSDGAVPWCSDRCPSFDGKRCEIIGQRPGRLCEPAVRDAIPLAIKGISAASIDNPNATAPASFEGHPAVFIKVSLKLDIREPEEVIAQTVAALNRAPRCAHCGSNRTEYKDDDPTKDWRCLDCKIVFSTARSLPTVDAPSPLRSFATAGEPKAHRCRYCGETSCTFHEPRCAEAQESMRKALANGMPPSGRHG